jgi:hypothetical protein
VSSAHRQLNQVVPAVRTGVKGSYAAFAAWLTEHPLAEDRPFGASSVRYQVARYCDYLEANPWPGGDPMRDPAARDGAVEAYGTYLQTFDAGRAVSLVLLSVAHFYQFLGLPLTGATPSSRAPAP